MLKKAAKVETNSTKSSARTDAETRITMIPIGSIYINRLRSKTDLATTAIASSVVAIGLHTPITVTPSKSGGFNVVAGVRRFWAAQDAGMDVIPCFIINDPEAAEAWKHSENLHRGNLSALARAEAIAAWSRRQAKDGQLGQVNKGGRGNKGGVADASRTAGISRTGLRRATAIADITPEAKREINIQGLVNNQSALLTIAAQSPETQLQKVRDLVVTRASGDPSAAEERELRALDSAWLRARVSVRQRFVDKTVMPFLVEIPPSVEQQ